MVGRNDPCPCGSGKKYKKCCGREEAVDLHEVIEVELIGIIREFIEGGFEPKEYYQLQQRFDKWQSALSDIFDRNLIESLAFETYVFHERVDLWQDYLRRKRKTVKRQRVRGILAMWDEPFYLLAEVEGIENGMLQLRDGVDGRLHQIRNKGNSGVGDRLFGIFMHSLQDDKPVLFSTNSVISSPEYKQPLIESLAARLKEGVDDALDLYLPFLETVSDLELSPFQEEVLELIGDFLAEYGLEEEMIQVIAIKFLLDVPLNARKPEGVAAGILQVANNIGLFGDLQVTKQVLAELLRTSVPTLSKYESLLMEYFMEQVDLEQDKMEQSAMSMVVTDMGTDPRVTERNLWEMLQRTKNARSEAEANSILQQPNRAYKPQTDAERAQLICYEAFEADGEERERLARQAFGLDSKSGDANLLLAEFVDHPLEKKNHYLQAIITGYRNFDQSFDVPWGYVLNRPLLRARFSYGAWLMVHGEYEEAIEQLAELMKLNPHDHQGAKWLLLSAYTKAGKWEEAGDLTNDFPLEDNGGKGMYFHYLSDLRSGVMSPAEIKEMEKDIKSRNRHLINLLKEGKEPGTFPRMLQLQAGSKDEAKLLYWLIHGIPEAEAFVGE